MILLLLPPHGPPGPIGFTPTTIFPSGGNDLIVSIDIFYLKSETYRTYQTYRVFESHNPVPVPEMLKRRVAAAKLKNKRL